MFFKDKTFAVFAFSAVLMAALGFMRPGSSGDTGMNIDLFWNSKISWKSKFDMVVVGDSRIEYAISPAEMEKIFPDFVIGNYGFQANLYTDDYLDAIAKTLNPESNNKIVVIGVTPLSLSLRISERNRFIERSELSGLDRFLFRRVPKVADFFRPARDEMFNLLLGKQKTDELKFEISPDGWLAAHPEQERRQETLDGYKQKFSSDEGKVSAESFNTLVNRVKTWTGSDIKVFAFRPPTAPEMVALENELSGYDEEYISTKLRDAGAVWLNFEEGSYESFDNSHLYKESAIMFSRDLAEKIKENMRNGN